MTVFFTFYGEDLFRDSPEMCSLKEKQDKRSKEGQKIEKV